MDGRVALPKGTLLDGSYRIERVIGTGGFGVSYEAEDVKLATRVAIKEYYPADFGRRDAALSVRPTSEGQKANFEWGRTSFLQEARTLARFRHSSIVQVTRVFEAYSTAYMVMTFESGQSLERWLKSLERLPTQDELDRIASPLLDAFQTMHAEQFLHRDIAPDNIIVRNDGTPVLLDFGAARRAVAERSRALTGIIKVGYSPHEQYAVDGRLQGPWTDLYAFGATLYRAVTGRVPEEASLRSMDDRLVPASVASQGSYRPAFLRSIDWCLKVRPVERPQSVDVLRAKLFEEAALPRTRPLPGERAARLAKPEPARAGSHASAIGLSLLATGGVLVFAAVVMIAVPSLRPGMPSRGGEDPIVPKAVASIAAPTPVEPPRPLPAVVPRRDPSKIIGRTLTPDEENRIGAGREFRECSDCPRMIVVPSGEFRMGSSDGFFDERPVHSVVIPKPFAVGRYEVTFAEWGACVADRACRMPGDEGWGLGSQPVINVSWDDVNKEFLPWLADKTGKPYRLPTEAEWEYAARGVTEPTAAPMAYSWGNDIGWSQANCIGCGSRWDFKRTAPVGSFAANGFGLYDMHGNVKEWVQDCYHNTYADTGSAAAAADSPDCARVHRGGSWNDNRDALRLTFRGKSRPTLRQASTGFRVARTLSVQAP